jgi:fumarylacetoacetase
VSDDSRAALDETHDPALRSWVESANDPATDFPIQNLPLGVFSRGEAGERRIGVAIGDMVLDLRAASESGEVAELATGVAHAAREQGLDGLMAIGRDASTSLRLALSRLLREGSAEGDARRAQAGALLVRAADVTLHLPCDVGDYTDFYASVHHATNVGSMFRPDNPLLPNYKWVPIGYHGRASSIVPSGTPVRRPSGQTREDATAPPTFGPSRRLDYELEIGAFVGGGNALGEPIPIGRAERHVFGLCLVNDWSARDIQTWEYQPLGPFLAKSFATTLSPWVVTLDALAPFRVPASARPDGDPAPLPHLSDPGDQAHGGVDIALELSITSESMRRAGHPPMVVSRGSFATMYWTLGQLVAHHTSNGCNLRPGDLLASGTVSGPTPESRGCLLERTWRGTEPLTLPTGETRRFLENGDEVVIRGWCERPGFRRVGFGDCRGIVVG